MRRGLVQMGGGLVADRVQLILQSRQGQVFFHQLFFQIGYRIIFLRAEIAVDGAGGGAQHRPGRL